MQARLRGDARISEEQPRLESAAKRVLHWAQEKASSIVKTLIVKRLGRLGPLPWPVVFIAICSCNGILAVLLGKQLDWDLLNYHFYNGYAFMTGRLDLDVAPAQVQTFLNPLLDAPLYLAIFFLPPILVGAAYGFVQGLNGCALWLIAREMLPITDVTTRAWAAFAMALLSGWAAIHVSELGGSMGDTLVSIPILFSVALLLGKREDLNAARLSVLVGWTALAGALSGIGVGLKITSAIYSVGLAVGCLFLVRGLRRRLLAAAAFASGAAGTWLLLGGFWLWQMWSRFGDPLFPFFRLFPGRAHSEFAGVAAAPDTRFLPKSWISASLYPFVWATNSSAVSEARFRDWRFPVLYVLLAALAIRSCVGGWDRARRAMSFPTGGAAFLMTGGLVSYALWLLASGVYRYLAPLEWLVPLAITLVLWILAPPRYRIAAIVAVLVLTTMTTKPGNWGRGGWTRDYFGITAPKLERGTGSMVLIAGLNGLSFVVPYFPADVRFIRLQSNSYLYGTVLGGAYGQPGPPNEFDRLVKKAVASYQGSLYVMLDGFNAPPHDRSWLAGAFEVDAVLAKLRLQLRAESCEEVRIRPTPSPPWAIFRRGYRQPPLMPVVTLCAAVRNPLDAPEFRGVGGPIARLYFAYFGRLPDHAALKHWVALQEGGLSLADISDAFAKSPGFQSTYGSMGDREFVTIAYRNVLGREPDPKGFGHWVGQLKTRALSRSQTMLALSESEEHKQTWHR